jgi:excisionase family DNA binding protein
MTTPEDMRTLTVQEAADLLATGAETIRRYVRDGHLVAMRWGGRLRFYAKDIAAFQQSRRIRPRDAAALANELLRRRSPAAAGVRDGKDA